MRFISMLRVSPSSKQPRLIPDPMERGFDVAVFRSAFQEFEDGSPEDRSAGYMGELIGTRVERLFITLKDLECRAVKFDYSEIAGAVAKFLNHQQVLLLRADSDKLQGVEQITQEAMGSLRSAKDHLGNEFTSREVLEFQVDAARNLLRQACDAKSFGGMGDASETSDIDAVLHVALRLGSMLESLRAQWHRVLWYGAHAHIAPTPPNNFVIDERPSRLALMAAIDVERRDVVRRRDIKEIERESLRGTFDTPKVLTFARSPSGERELTVIRVLELPPKLLKAAFGLAQAYDAMINHALEPFLSETVPELAGVSLRSVLRAWYCLAFLTFQQSTEASVANDFDRLPAEEFITRIQSDELAKALSSVLDLTTDEARRIIRFLTYGGRRQSIWSHPILDTTEGVLLLWYPLQGAHLMRLLHEWGRAHSELRDEYSDRGHKFEDLVHLIIANLKEYANPAVPYVPMRSRLKVPGKTPAGNYVGDVDGAFVVEDTLFIMECRMLMEPAEPFEFWTVQEELKAKIEKVTTKKNFLLGNREVIETWASDRDAKDLPDIKRIVSLVVSNSFLLEGERTDEPYFVHIDTLFNVLLSGYSEYGGGWDDQGKPFSFRIEHLREDMTQADAVLDALRNPVKAESAKASAVVHQARVPPFDASDSSGIILAQVIKWPDSTQQIEALLKRCSFWPKISRLSSV